MSLLRRALGQTHERRATGVTIRPSSGTLVAERPAGYGQVGAGAWGPGMTWNTWLGGASGAPITTGSSLALSAVFACLRLLSEGIATLPLDTFIRRGGVRQPYRPRPAYLDFLPPGMSRIVYLSQVMLSMLTAGDAFVYTPRDKLGVPTGLIVLDPDRVTVINTSGTITYKVMGVSEEFSALDIMHIPAMMLPGSMRGISPLGAARAAIEGGVRAQEYGRDFLSNHAVPPAVIEVPGMGGTAEAERDKARKIGATWKESHGGSNVGNIGVLIGGATLKSIAIKPDEAQWLESKRFTVSEIARFYGVPPHLIADASNSTSWGSGLAEQNLAFGQFSLRPWIERIEDAHGRLLTTHGAPDVFVKLNLDAVLRASLKDRYASYAVGISSRFLTVNEARALEDLPPVPWGDEPPATPPPLPPAPGPKPTGEPPT